MDGLFVQLYLCFRRCIEVDIDAVYTASHVCKTWNHGKGAWAVGVAAVNVESALAFTFYTKTFKRRVFGNLAAVGFHGSHQSIVNGGFNIVGVYRVVGNLEQTFIELHPGEGNTSFHAVVSGACLALFASVPAFLGCARTTNIDFFVHDVARDGFHNLQIAFIFYHFVKFQQAHVARHHFVGFLSVLGAPPFFFVLNGETVPYRNVGLGQQLWSTLLLAV